MKKYISIILALALIACLFAGCGSSAKPESQSAELSIVTTIFPEYDWVMNVLGDNPACAKVTMLLDNGVDLHSYQPSADDMLKIADCDLFIYVGGESDGWADDALSEAVNKNMVVINLLDELGDAVKEEEIVEGMEAEEEHDHDHEESEEHNHDGDEDHDHEEEEEGPEYDEHVWLSLRNAAALTGSISQALQKLDPTNAALYKANAEEYTAKLKALDEDYKAAVAASSVKTLLFGDRFPFRYLTDDYGLNYYAAFVGCSAETEASFETIVFLANKVDELSLGAVMTIEGKDHNIAETIVNNTASGDQKIITMDSMQATTGKDAQNGVTYLSIMEANLSALKEALQ